MSEQANILWISLESVRADHTSLYQYQRETTPRLQELGERSNATVIDPMVSASMWTPASSASMLTGTHMSTHQVGRDGKAKKKLSSEVNTLPELLSNVGYNTALFTTNPYISPDTGLGRGFQDLERVSVSRPDFIGVDSLARDSIKTAIQAWRESRILSPRKLRQEILRSDNYLLEHRVKRWIEHSDSGDPFFLYTHIPSPHHEYSPVRRFRTKFIDEIEATEEEALEISEGIYTGSEGIRRRMASGLNLSDFEREAILALYDAEIAYADYTAAQLVSAAEATSDRDLITVVVGDHGDLFGEYGLIGHNLVLHDGLIKVPGLVLGIDDVIENADTVTQHIDLTKTIGSITGVDTEQFVGRDIRSSRRPYAISQRGLAHFDSFTKYDETFDTSRFFEEEFTSIRTNQWKYLVNSSKSKLYSLPNETQDVKQENPEVAGRLSEILSEEQIDWKEKVQTDATEFSKKSKQRLEDLGYLS